MIVSEAKPIPLILSRDLTRALKRGHPWVFADALAAVPEAPPGTPALLLDKKKKPLALGFCEPKSPLTFRACSTDVRRPLDSAWAAQRFGEALSLRQHLVADGQTDGYRLFNGEGDGLPGLVVDIYGDSAAVRLDGEGAAQFWQQGEGVAQWLMSNLQLRRVHCRARGHTGGRTLVGPALQGPVPFVEHGVRFTADLEQGQKTGFFLDQRENRRRVGQLSAGKQVLNVFAYTGGFSIYAGLGGAAQVTTVDLAAPAVQAAEAHWALNCLDPALHEAIVGDAFEVLDGAAASSRSWDLVIVDPPSFAPRRSAAAAAVAAYSRLAAAGARVTRPGGLLAAASCSSHVDAAAFLGAVEEGVSQARRRARVLEIAGQPVDHPSPLPLPEFRYLKFVLMQIS